MKRINFTNKKINMLTVIKKAESKNRRAFWLCKCDCGNEIKVMSQDLIYKTKYSCGCTRKPVVERKRKYETKNQRLYNIWHAMKQRCYDDRKREYKYYGGKGIKICDEWLSNFEAFQEWSLKSGYKSNLTIDRINAEKDYCPENCRWITQKENNLNRRGIIRISYNDKTICLKDYCKIKNISYSTTLKKYKKGIKI